MITDCIKTIIPVTPAATPQVVNTTPPVINQFVQPTTLVTTTSTTTDRVEISHDLVQTGDRETPMTPHTVRLSRNTDRSSTLSTTDLAASAARRIASPQRRSTRLQYKGKIEAFKRWCNTNGVVHHSPEIKDIINFMEFKFVVEGRQPRTIQGYRSAFTDYFDPAKLDIKRSRQIQRLIKAYFKERPPALNIPQPWDVQRVLEALKRPPFEPMSIATLKFVTLKTVFLTALATGRRRSEIHAFSHISVRSTFIDGNEVINIKTVPAFLTKNQRENSSPNSTKKILIPSLKEVLGPDLWDSDDKLLCPVRSIKHYLKRTRSLRKDRQLLFISWQLNRETEIKPGTISSWIKQAIYSAYGGKKSGVKAHQTRSAGASWAYATGASMNQVMEACYWKSSSTFTSHYLRDYWTSEVDSNMHHLGPFCGSRLRC